MQHNTLSFPVTEAFIAMVSSCRNAKDHRQTWGSDQQGPALWLVKDHGIYLMSNEMLPETEEKKSAPLVYAQECDPTTMEFDDWWVAGEQLLGGDDSVTPIELEIFESLIAKGKKLIRFKVNPTTGELRIFA